MAGYGVKANGTWAGLSEEEVNKIFSPTGDSIASLHL